MVKDKKALKKKEKLNQREKDLVVQAYNNGFSEGYENGLIKGYQRAMQLVMVTVQNDLNNLLTPSLQPKQEVK